MINFQTRQQQIANSRLLSLGYKLLSTANSGQTVYAFYFSPKGRRMMIVMGGNGISKVYTCTLSHIAAPTRVSLTGDSNRDGEDESISD